METEMTISQTVIIDGNVLRFQLIIALHRRSSHVHIVALKEYCR